MPVSDIKKILGIILSCTSLVFLWFDMPIIASCIAVPPFIMLFMGFKGDRLFLTAFLFSCIAVGLVVDYPFHGFPLFSCLFFGLWLVFVFRLLLFERIGNHSFILIEVIMIQALVVATAVAGILSDIDLRQWLTLALPLLLIGMFSFVIYSGAIALQKIMAKDLKLGKGSKAPDFNLEDQNGSRVCLKDILANNHALLIFVRGEWCPSCHITLRSYVNNKEVLTDKKVKIVGIGPDPSGVNREIMNRIDPEAILLADTDQELALAYSAELEPNNPMTKSLYTKGIPLPASFLVHMNGNIIFTSRSDKAGEILQPDKIFDVLAKL